MRPVFIVNDITDSASTYSKVLSKLVLRNVASAIEAAYLKYLCFGEFCPRAPFAIQTAVLLNHVSYVIQLVAKKQMGWIDTRWIIALMQDTHPIWNRAVMQFPGGVVSKDQSLTSSPYLHAPISMFIPTTNPQPTGFRLLNLCPKALFKRLRHATIAFTSSGITCLATILASVSSKSALLHFKEALAVLASDNDTLALSEMSARTTAKQSFSAFVGDVDKLFAATFTGTNMRGCVKMVLHAKLTFRVPRLWSVPPLAGASFCSFPYIIPHLGRVF
jgi:hypothetical protein